jgi:hypothetical protein
VPSRLDGSEGGASVRPPPSARIRPHDSGAATATDLVRRAASPATSTRRHLMYPEREGRSEGRQSLLKPSPRQGRSPAGTAHRQRDDRVADQERGRVHAGSHRARRTHERAGLFSRSRMRCDPALHS